MKIIFQLLSRVEYRLDRQGIAEKVAELDCDRQNLDSRVAEQILHCAGAGYDLDLSQSFVDETMRRLVRPV